MAVGVDRQVVVFRLVDLPAQVLLLIRQVLEGVFQQLRDSFGLLLRTVELACGNLGHLGVGDEGEAFPLAADQRPAHP
ncbi:hypothetical protein LHJ74_11135 [Streptomyces sp. N2-109]|uniref:Transposase n=1 Tax=Streptomyces gossypii TaxID=2883101 RepID=A0ABT2JRE2_9ACTN|nr:hypothetical protein [Streptomyces gossypii]MCT2590457.1 hypothetical protein [Streptomyces gossypii]